MCCRARVGLGGLGRVAVCDGELHLLLEHSCLIDVEGGGLVAGVALGAATRPAADGPTEPFTDVRLGGAARSFAHEEESVRISLVVRAQMDRHGGSEL